VSPPISSRCSAKTKSSPAQVAEQLCLLEQREREARNLARRAKMATLGAPKAMDRFDWNHPRWRQTSSERLKRSSQK
jgi:hypothetical protein